jgi:hypothetical protein
MLSSHAPLSGLEAVVLRGVVLQRAVIGESLRHARAGHIIRSG